MPIINALSQLKQLTFPTQSLTEEQELKITALRQNMSSIFRQQQQFQIYKDDHDVSTARHCLLQKEIADALTTDVILYLFSYEEGRNLKIRTGLPIYRVIELGFSTEKEDIGRLWHYSAECDQQLQDSILEQYKENTQRICDAILLTLENITKAQHPLIENVSLSNLLEDYQISLHQLLEENKISFLALRRHNGFADHLKIPLKELLDSLYIYDLKKLYEEQQKLDNSSTPLNDFFNKRVRSIPNPYQNELQIDRIYGYINEAYYYYSCKCYRTSIKEQLLRNKDMTAVDILKLTEIYETAKMILADAKERIQYQIEQLSPPLQVILENAFVQADNVKEIDWTSITSPADYQCLLQTFLSQFIEYLNQTLQMEIPIPLLVIPTEGTTPIMPGQDLAVERASECHPLLAIESKDFSLPAELSLQRGANANLLRPEGFPTQSFFYRKLHDREYLTKHRNDDPIHRQLYDEQFGLVLRK